MPSATSSKPATGRGSRGPRADSMQAAVRAAIAQHGQDRAKVVGLVAEKFPTYSRSNINRSYTRVVNQQKAPAAAAAPAPAPASPPARTSARKVVKVDGYADAEPDPADSGHAAVRQSGAGDDAGRSGPPVASAGTVDPGGESGSGVDPGPVTRPVERVAPAPAEPAGGRTKGRRRRQRSGPAYGHLFGW